MISTFIILFSLLSVILLFYFVIYTIIWCVLPIILLFICFVRPSDLTAVKQTP